MRQVLTLLSKQMNYIVNTQTSTTIVIWTKCFLNCGLWNPLMAIIFQYVYFKFSLPLNNAKDLKFGLGKIFVYLIWCFVNAIIFFFFNVIAGNYMI